MSASPSIRRRTGSMSTSDDQMEFPWMADDVEGDEIDQHHLQPPEIVVRTKKPSALKKLTSLFRHRSSSPAPPPSSSHLPSPSPQTDNDLALTPPTPHFYNLPEPLVKSKSSLSLRSFKISISSTKSKAGAGLTPPPTPPSKTSLFGDSKFARSQDELVKPQRNVLKKKGSARSLKEMGLGNSSSTSLALKTPPSMSDLPRRKSNLHISVVAPGSGTRAEEDRRPPLPPTPLSASATLSSVRSGTGTPRTPVSPFTPITPTTTISTSIAPSTKNSKSQSESQSTSSSHPSSASSPTSPVFGSSNLGRKASIRPPRKVADLPPAPPSPSFPPPPPPSQTIPLDEDGNEDADLTIHPSSTNSTSRSSPTIPRATLPPQLPTQPASLPVTPIASIPSFASLPSFPTSSDASPTSTPQALPPLKDPFLDLRYTHTSKNSESDFTHEDHNLGSGSGSSSRGEEILRDWTLRGSKSVEMFRAAVAYGDEGSREGSRDWNKGDGMLEVRERQRVSSTSSGGGKWKKKFWGRKSFGDGESNQNLHVHSYGHKPPSLALHHPQSAPSRSPHSGTGSPLPSPLLTPPPHPHTGLSVRNSSVRVHERPTIVQGQGMGSYYASEHGEIDDVHADREEEKGKWYAE